MRMTIVAATLLTAATAGCPATHADGAGGGAAPAMEIPSTTPAPQGADRAALDEGFTREHPWRAVLGAVGHWKPTLEEEWRESAAGSETWHHFDVLVADRQAGAVQVVGENEDLLVAIWIPENDLALVTVQQVALVSGSGGSLDADDPGVRLAGGTPVERLEQSGGWSRVRVSLPELQAEGWVPDVLLARIYRSSDFDTTGVRVALEPAVGLEVRSSSIGGVVAVLRPEADAVVRVRALGEPTLGWQEIEVPTARFLVRGVVEVEGLAAVVEEEAPGPSHTIAAWRIRGEHHWLQVPIGQQVLDAPEGDPFAVTTMGTKLMVDVTQREPKRTAVTIRTVWGETTGWVVCEPVPDGMPQPIIDTCVIPWNE
ncbi:MAG: hypothetical protein JXB32_25425 [Deltaproteobacteria bacterium]|nr:hypothetical protein [Deltaproteobacteria bacterium]